MFECHKVPADSTVMAWEVMEGGNRHVEMIRQVSNVPVVLKGTLETSILIVGGLYILVYPQVLVLATRKRYCWWHPLAPNCEEFLQHFGPKSPHSGPVACKFFSTFARAPYLNLLVPLAFLSWERRMKAACLALDANSLSLFSIFGNQCLWKKSSNFAWYKSKILCREVGQGEQAQHNVFRRTTIQRFSLVDGLSIHACHTKTWDHKILTFRAFTNDFQTCNTLWHPSSRESCLLYKGEKENVGVRKFGEMLWHNTFIL